MRRLAHTTLVAGGAAPSRWVVFLHGIFGRGGNWRGVARRLVDARRDLGAVLVDLRAHGGSLGLPPPHTVAACAEDVCALEPSLPGPVGAVVGHSFGGKVALSYLARRPAPPGVAWIVDSMPGPRDDSHPTARGPERTRAVLRLLEALPPALPSHEAFVEAVRRGGLDEGTARWLAQSLRRVRDPGGDRFVLSLDLPAIAALLDDYFALDLWPVVERPPAGATVHLAIADRSWVFTDEDRARADRAAAATAAPSSPGRLVVHHFPTGHYVHVEAPDALHAALAATLPRG